tara:strand:+ start:2067 stop:2831 length:765 start_codon:yes stop_codon:yes gene_type:complete
MIGYKKCPHVNEQQSPNELIINHNPEGLEYDLKLTGSKDALVSYRREMRMDQRDHYQGYLSKADLNRDTSSNKQINQPHAIIAVGFRLHEKVRVYDFFRHTTDSKSTTGHVVASMLGIQQGFSFARPWADSPIDDWIVFLPASKIIINGVEQGDKMIETINGNGLDDIIPMMPTIQLSMDNEDNITAQLLEADGTNAFKENVEIFLETTTGVLRENRIYTNNVGKASTKILFKGRGKVKAGFKHFTGKTEIEIR